jgi:hypothetical protein
MQIFETCYLQAIRGHLSCILLLSSGNNNGPSTQVPLPLLQVQVREEGESKEDYSDSL